MLIIVWCKNKMGQSQKYLSNLKNKIVQRFVLLVLSRGKSSFIHSFAHLSKNIYLVHSIYGEVKIFKGVDMFKMRLPNPHLQSIKKDMCIPQLSFLK